MTAMPQFPSVPDYSAIKLKQNAAWSHVLAANVWEYLRKNKLANRLYETYEDIVEACCDAWNSLMASPDRIASIDGHLALFGTDANMLAQLDRNLKELLGTAS